MTTLDIFYIDLKQFINSSSFDQQVDIEIRNHQSTKHFQKNSKPITNPNLKFQNKIIAENQKM